MHRFGYNFSYFDVGFPLGTKPRPVLEPQVLLLHHINLMLTTHGKLFQLGGEVAANEIRDAVGVHATCYERATKLLGLKAANAYWNFMNYDPNRRTLTKVRNNLFSHWMVFSCLPFYLLLAWHHYSR